MKIFRLIQSMPVRLLRGSEDVEVRDLEEDSRQCTAGCLFIARQGTVDDGSNYIEEAVSKGAVAVLSEKESAWPAEFPPELPPEIAILQSPDLPRTAAVLAERFHGHPSRELALIGITGTNGKTTTAHLIHQLLGQRGIRAGLIGTIHIDDGQDIIPSRLTTPSACELSRLLRNMVDHGCKACVMEVSSHALQQRRVAGLEFDIGVFTNLSGDHLDYHGTMEEYAEAKARLFRMFPEGGWAIVNADDSAAEEMVRDCAASVLTCSTLRDDADCTVKIEEETIDGMRIILQGPWGNLDAHLPLVGRVNAMNALQAVACIHQLEHGFDGLATAMASCVAPPGRLERVTPIDHEFTVLVDYAHTDDALFQTLSALKPLLTKEGKLRVVFGCGGDRDRAKRPRMARAACRFADDIIITSDNPRTEPPEAIIEEIMVGVPDSHRNQITTLVDRTEAITEAIARVLPQDIILIAGKGHEDYQIIGRDKRPFDDRLIAAAAINSLPAEAAV